MIYPDFMQILPVYVYDNIKLGFYAMVNLSLTPHVPQMKNLTRLSLFQNEKGCINFVNGRDNIFNWRDVGLHHHKCRKNR